METKAKKRGRPGKAPTLVSTRATLAYGKILDYDGYDFTFKCRAKRRIKYSDVNITNIVRDYLNGIILPNALILKDAGIIIPYEEVGIALRYCMVTGKSKENIEYWENCKKAQNFPAWFDHVVGVPVEYYIHNHPKDKNKKIIMDKILPDSMKATLKSYLQHEIRKHFTWTQHLKPFKHTTTKGINKLVNAYAEDRSIEHLSNKELVERFKVSDHTIAKFHQWLKQRAAKGIDYQYTVVERKYEKVKRMV